MPYFLELHNYTLVPHSVNLFSAGVSLIKFIRAAQIFQPTLRALVTSETRGLKIKKLPT